MASAAPLRSLSAGQAERRLADLRQRIALARQWVEGPLEVRKHGLPLASDALRLRDGVGAPADADDGEVVEQRSVDLHGGDLPGGEEPISSRRPCGVSVGSESVNRSPPTGSTTMSTHRPTDLRKPSVMTYSSAST